MTQPEDLIVGRSVEEIEADSGNRVNSSVPGEAHHDAVPVLIPAGGGQLGGQIGTGQAGVLGGLPGIIGTELEDDGSGTDSSGSGRSRKGHADRDLNSSEE